MLQQMLALGVLPDNDNDKQQKCVNMDDGRVNDLKAAPLSAVRPVLISNVEFGADLEIGP